MAASSPCPAASARPVTLTNEPDGATTLIAGPVADQAALHGLLTKIRDLGLPLLEVRRLDPD